MNKLNNSDHEPFCGSYQPGDVNFLLKRVHIKPIDVAKKEKAIQSGRHYSEMLSEEKTPDASYLELFHTALKLNAGRLGKNLADLVVTLCAMWAGRERPVVLVSLARAGTPIGVLLKRGIEASGHKAVHYCVSIIRGLEIDWVALDYIRKRHPDTDIVFVDGWTGKGAITTELHSSVQKYNLSRNARIVPLLVVISDLAGVADIAATADDYLIPSAVLNSVVSGLVSRTVFSNDYVGQNDFHSCVYYSEKAGEDLSQFFIDSIMPELLKSLPSGQIIDWSPSVKDKLSKKSKAFIAYAMEHYGVGDIKLVKPGIGEATRVLLRRVPKCLVLREHCPDVQHLIALAQAQGVPIIINSALPYRAAAFIKTID